MVRASTAIFLGSSVLFASAFSFMTPPKQDAPKKAEEQFKNITSFKGEAASEIIPAMQLMSASLGVACSYCHVDGKWDSDDKREKGTAREMIAMTRDLNAKSFGGRKTITCFTCHGGHTRPSNTPMFAGVTRRFRADATMAADSVLFKYREAIGGDAAIADLKTLHLTGTSTRAGGAPSSVEYYQAAPNKFVLTTHGEHGDQKAAFNGVDTWVGTVQGARKMDEAHTQLVQRAGRFFRDSASLPTFAETAAGKVVIDGKTYSVVSGTVPSAHERDLLYFDPETGLLDRVAYFTTTILGDLPEVYLYSDYRKVGGVMIPFKVTEQGAAGSSVTQFATSEANVKLSDDLFNLPKP